MNGPIFAIIAAVLFGLSAPVAKSLIGTIDPWFLASILYLGSGVGMAIIFIGRAVTQRRGFAKISLADFPWLLGVTLFGGVIGPVLLMYGLTHTPASTASLLLNIEGVLTAGLAWLAFKEHYDRRIVLGMLSIIVGSVILSWEGNLSLTSLNGPLLVGGACLCWAVDNNLTRKISLNDPILLTMFKSLVAGVTNLILAVSVGAQVPGVGFLIMSGTVGFFCYGLSIVCFILALRHLGASRTGAYFSSAPFVGALCAIVFWREPITSKLLVAAVFMGFGIYLHLSESHSHEHEHVEIEHEHAHSHDDEHHLHEHGPLDPSGEPHTHHHRHSVLLHSHPHFPDMHHQHEHG